MPIRKLLHTVLIPACCLLLVSAVLFIGCQEESPENEATVTGRVLSTEELAGERPVVNLQTNRDNTGQQSGFIPPEGDLRQENDVRIASVDPADRALDKLLNSAEPSHSKAALDTEMDYLHSGTHTAKSTLDSFLEALLRGEIASGTLLEENSFLLELELEPILDGEISLEHYRTGVFRESDSGYRLAVRLFTSRTSAVSEITLSRTNGTWKISDIVVPWDDLRQSAGTPRFQPASHTWTIGSGS
ncbi:hypothetical protein [Spirochaeta dissipatitropha]